MVHELAKDLVEQIAFEARKSEYVDAKSGVSARLTISAMRTLLPLRKEEVLLNNEKITYIRVSDFIGVVVSRAVTPSLARRECAARN